MRAAKPVRFDRERTVMMQETKVLVLVEDDMEPIRISLPDQSASLTVKTSWNPGQKVWHGTINGSAIIAQVRSVLNGVMIAHGGSGTTARVYTHREAQLKWETAGSICSVRCRDL
jgi:propionyl-CoA carboxylase alpha chain